MILPDDVVERVRRAILVAIRTSNVERDALAWELTDEELAHIARAALEAARWGELAEIVRLFPEAHDTLTNQEMRDAKGNLRSLIDQQTNALTKLRALLSTIGEPTDIGASQS